CPALVARTGVRLASVPARARILDAAGLRRRGGRLARDRARPSAVDRAGDHEDLAGRDAHARSRGSVRAVHGDLLRARGGRDHAHPPHDPRDGAVIDSVVVLALALAGSLTFYALLGGADYGGGLWDLLATGPSAARQRATIARAIGPVWEANHVWLII